MLVDEKLNMSWQLAAHKSGQQCKGGDSAPSHCSCETPHKHSDLDDDIRKTRTYQSKSKGGPLSRSPFLAEGLEHLSYEGRLRVGAV